MANASILPEDRYVEPGYIEDCDNYISWGPIVFWQDKVIVVPRNMLTYVNGSVYLLDTTLLKAHLKYQESTQLGIAHDKILQHSAGVMLSGTQYAGFLEIINGYTVTFENGVYTVSVSQNYNNNIMDVNNANYVNVLVQNSAGLQTVQTGASVLKDDEREKLMSIETLTANRVWEYTARTLSVQTGMTQEEHDQLMNSPTSGDIASAVWDKELE